MASRYATRTGTEFWRATWTIFGKQRSKCGFATQAEAEAFEAPLRGDDGMEGFSPDAVIARSKSTKLGAWLLIWWKQGYDRWTPETRRSYQRAINGVLAPYLQNVPLYSLTSPNTVKLVSGGGVIVVACLGLVGSSRSLISVFRITSRLVF